VMKILAERFITRYCKSKPAKAKEFFNKYIGAFDDSKSPLPDCRTMWRFRLFVLSLCPKVFKDELKKSFFRLFSVKKRYHRIISDAEYGKALQKSFDSFDIEDRREYVDKVIEYFAQKQKEEKDKRAQEEKWHLKYGSRILSVIMRNEIVKERQEEIEKLGFVLDKDYKPEPSISRVRGGTIIPRGPIPPEKFHKKSIKEIIGKLKTDWSPEKLREKYKNDDFLRPRSAEGAGELLRNDIPTRFQEYINKASFFFDREKLDPHYTYSFLRGIQEILRDNKVDVENVNWNNLIELFIAIKKSGEENPFNKERHDRDHFDAWLADWTAVHSAIVDIVQELLKEKDGKSIIDFLKSNNDIRDKILEIIGYLLSYSDPTPEREKDENDPYTRAINTVRGRAFEAFILFVYQDGKKFKENKKIKISKDAKNIYKKVLGAENTRAIMFMFGHHLPSFYFRNREWIKKLLPKIFPQDKKDLFLASAEGYLTQSLYKEMFFDQKFQELYKKWVALEDVEYSNRQKHFKDINKALADHLALAFIYFDIKFNKNEGFSDKLFKAFWSAKNMNNQTRHHEFIAFIGRHIFSKDRAGIIIKQHKIDIKKLESFWEWTLKDIEDKKILAGFGFWVNPNEEVIKDKKLAKRMAETLEKSEGGIDWEYGLFKRLPVLAEANKEDVLEIIKYYFLDKNGKTLNGNNRSYETVPIYKEEIKRAIKTIYEDEEQKEKVIELINILIKEGSNQFWFLADIIN